MGPICFFRKDASNDMQYDLLGSARDLDLWSNFEIDLFRATCSYFDAFRREEHDAAKIMCLAFLVQKLFAKKQFLQKSAILTFLDLYSLIC